MQGVYEHVICIYWSHYLQGIIRAQAWVYNQADIRILFLTSRALFILFVILGCFMEAIIRHKTIDLEPITGSKKRGCRPVFIHLSIAKVVIPVQCSG